MILANISVIVPVYNAESYLADCIESILAQSYTEFELLLIDDGSKDKSGIICDSYADKDPRVRVIHKENGGVSSARNLGLSIASGEYIAFVDSDDWVEEKFFEKAIEACRTQGLGIYMGGIARMYPDGKREESVVQYSFHGHANEVKEKQYIDLIDTNYGVSSVAKLFKREIVENKRFDETLSWGEDLKFVTDLLQGHIQIMATNEVVYYYRVGHSSITSRIDLDKCRCFVRIYTYLYNESDRRKGLTDIYSAYIEKRMYADLLSYEQLILCSQMSYSEKMEMLQIVFSISQVLKRIKNNECIKHFRLYANHPRLLMVRHALSKLCSSKKKTS